MYKNLLLAAMCVLGLAATSMGQTVNVNQLRGNGNTVVNSNRGLTTSAVNVNSITGNGNTVVNRSGVQQPQGFVGGFGLGGVPVFLPQPSRNVNINQINGNFNNIVNGSRGFGGFGGFAPSGLGGLPPINANVNINNINGNGNFIRNRNP